MFIFLLYYYVENSGYWLESDFRTSLPGYGLGYVFFSVIQFFNLYNGDDDNTNIPM